MSLTVFIIVVLLPLLISHLFFPEFFLQIPIIHFLPSSLYVNAQDDDEGTDNDSMNDNDFDYNEEDAEDPLLGRTKVLVRIMQLFKIFLA